LAAGGAAYRSAPVLCLVAGTVLGSIVVAWQSTSGARPQRPTAAEALAAVPQAAFGVCAGGLLLFVPVARIVLLPGTAQVSPAAAAASVAALAPLSVSMGVAEWLLVRYRAATYRELQHATSPRAFATRSGVALLRTAAGYLAVLTAGCLGAALIVARNGPTPAADALAGYLWLGVSLFVALLLMSLQIRGPAVLGCGVALAAELALLAVRPEPALVQLWVTATLAIGLLGYSVRALASPTRHL
jgi:hypothetical protein